MTPQRAEQVEELFHSALEQPAGSRRAFLAEACEGDAALLAEVESLISASTDAPAFLEEPGCGVLTRGTASGSDGPRFTNGRSLAGERIGAWQLVEKIAGGGMGSVYLARRADGHYEKNVAIKLIGGALDEDDPKRRNRLIRRFRDELKHHANLDHPNVAKLLDGGTTEQGLPYLVMEYVDGQPVDEYCESRQMAIDDRMKLFRTICRAVQHAHNRFVAHCDIKPSNILVCESPEPGGEPVPKLLDFGIAKMLKPDGDGQPETEAMTRLRPMTPSYASPEQIRNEPITAASDVYSLGVVLYQLVCGSLPYEVSEYDAKRVICEEVPRPPSAVKQTLNKEIDAIALKALEKDPARRYASAAALAEDIERYQTGRPILAHEESVLYNVRKFVVRRRSRIAGILTVVALIAAGIAVGVLIGSLSKEVERRTAETERSDKINQLDQMGRRLRADALRLLAEGDQAEAAEKFTDATAGYRQSEEKLTDAVLCFRMVLEMERQGPPGSVPRSRWLSAETRRLLGHCYSVQGEYELAEPYLLGSYGVIQSHFGDQDQRTQETRDWLVELYEAWGLHAKAAEFRRPARRTQRPPPGTS